MNYAPHYVVRYNGYHPGLGQQSSDPFDTVSGTASFAVGEGGALAAASLALVGLGPIGAIVGVATQIIAMIIQHFHGCGQSCILTSQAADQIEGGIKQMFNAYMQSGHTKSEQQVYLQQFDALWQKLEQYCGSGSFGKAGENCVSDRQAGACKWKSSTWGWTQQNGTWTFVPSGPAGSGTACWNWVDYYRGTVANDPTVVPDTPAVTQAVADLGLTGLGGMNLAPLLIIAGLVALAVVL